MSIHIHYIAYKKGYVMNIFLIRIGIYIFIFAV